MIELSELNSYQEASLFCSDLSEWQEGPQVLTYGAILLCRKGRAVMNVNYKEWDLYEGAVITLFPNDVVEVKKVEPSASCEGDACAGMNASAFEVEMLKYNPSLLREASLQLEQTVYSAPARGPMPAGFARGYPYHREHVFSPQTLFRAARRYLYLAAGTLSAQGLLHRVP